MGGDSHHAPDQPQRLSAEWGRWLDREHPITVSFDGHKHAAYPGDTLASAFAAGGTLTIGRSFKYHRPRGCLTFTGDDANGLVQVGAEPNARAEWARALDGRTARAQNVLGSASLDLLAIMQWAKPLLPVGFYYRGLYKPRGIWPFWEKFVRQAAGLGSVATDTPKPEVNDKVYLFTDVCVVGGGPAGMQAAITAARAGAEVVLVEGDPELGGHLLYERPFEDKKATRNELAQAVAHESNITVMAWARATGWFDDHFLAIHRGERLYKLRAQATVIATGATPHPALFPDNDRPGIMTPVAAQRLMYLYGVKPGERAVVCALDRRDYNCARDLQDAGVNVVAVTDLAGKPKDSNRAEAVKTHGAAVRHGGIPVGTKAGRGGRIKAVKLGEADGSNGEWLKCDLLVVRGGDQPRAELAAQAGGRLVFDSGRLGYTVDPATAQAGVFVAGRVAGTDGRTSQADGHACGDAAARYLGFTPAHEPPERAATGDRALGHPQVFFGARPDKTFVDLDEDVTVKDLHRAIDEGFDQPDLLKRFSTAVMGPSQGKHSAANFLRVRARYLSEQAGLHQPTTNRPPTYPEPVRVLAGRNFQPERFTPMDNWHRENGAQMMPAGLWWRPAYYGPRDQRAETITAEVEHVRGKAGLIDVSTLGGLLIRGPDAVQFMSRAFTFAYKKQPVGRVRYMLLTTEDGRITDDGVACRLGENEFYVTATTGGVDAAYRLLLQLNAEWGLQVDIVNVTGAWCGVNVAGPRSRQVMQALDSDLDFSAAGFPYMNVKRGQVAGIPAIVFRVGFVGELGYEVHVPAGYGLDLWERLLAAGQKQEIKPFGVEAQRVMRLEKGHILVGQDSDGMSHPSEARMGWAVARKKGAFHGSAAIKTLENLPRQRQLVGITLSADSPVPEQACLTLTDDDRIAGRITSMAWSPTLGYPVGLAYVAPQQAEEGRSVTVKLTDGTRLRASVTEPPFVDPENKRQEV